MWLARTPTTDKRKVATSGDGPVRAFSDVVAESPFASPAVGWIQRAVLSGVTPQSNAVLQSPSAVSPDASAGDSPALEWKIARDMDTAAQDPRASLDDTLIGQAVATTLRDFAVALQDAGSTPGLVPASPLSTPIAQATPSATQPTVAASGGFDVTTPLSEDNKSCSAELASQPSPSTSAEQIIRKTRSASLPRYSCTLLGFREVCKQDPMHPTAFPQAFSLFIIEVALPDHDLGRAKLVVAEKRFSEFVKLDVGLRESMQSEHLGWSTQRWAPALPPKRLWPTRASVVVERQHGLQNYLDWVVTLEAETPRRILLEWLVPHL